MKQLFETDELIGKTIKGVFGEYKEQMIITFTDESFAVFIDDKCPYDKVNEIAIDGNEFNLIPSRQNYSKLFECGMISQYVFDELDPYFKQMDADEAKEKADNIKREEIHKLQQLAQKYPDIATLK